MSHCPIETYICQILWGVFWLKFQFFHGFIAYRPRPLTSFAINRPDFNGSVVTEIKSMGTLIFECHFTEHHTGTGAQGSFDVKIADHDIRFCAIPLIRGRLRSRSVTAIMDEVRALVGNGTREVILVSQDTTSWGLDRADGSGLCRFLASIRGAVRPPLADGGAGGRHAGRCGTGRRSRA